MRGLRSVVLGVAIASGLVGAAPAAATGGVTWTAPTRLGSTNRTTCQHALAASTTSTGPAIHAVYRVASAETAGDDRVFYRRSLDGGATWPTVTTITANPNVYKACPTVAAWGNVIVVAWLQFTVGGSTGIHYRVSTDGGRRWGADGRVPTPHRPGNPSVAVSATAIQIAWTDNRPPPTWSRLATSRDRGGTWTVRAIDAKPSESFAPGSSTIQVAASGSRVFAAWIRAGTRDVFGRASTDSGASWSAPELLAVLPPALFSYPLFAPFSIAARPDRMAIVWSGGWAVDPGHPQMFVRVFAAGSWGSPSAIAVSSDPGATPYGYLSSPAVTLLASTRVSVAAVVCTDYRAIDPDYGCGEATGGQFDAYWTESTNNGGAWTTPVDINGGPLVYVDTVSAVWPSANVRGVLVDWATGETEWRYSVYVYRGAAMS